ncbi:uncharacterized protein LOC132697954 [Cylas formicarius]|uniref:uncharacterized protein LOC132697954 n=1 Tax=Cylas formicarius TaxID=197179 RepID=UPI00295880B4|nr:uncharacterized protein LOC132697954 [Cylas formicarius]
MPQCFVETCGNYYGKTRGNSKIIYHMLPADAAMAAKWIRTCGKPNGVANSYVRVCSEHFSEKCYQRDLQHELLGLPLRRKLKAGAVPDKNLPPKRPPKPKDLHGDVSTKPDDFQATATSTPVKEYRNKIYENFKMRGKITDDVLREKDSAVPKLNNKMNRLPMRSSIRIAKKKSIESLSDSFTEKVNSKVTKENKPEKFTDKLKFMAKLQLRFERNEHFPVTLPKYNMELSLRKMADGHRYVPIASNFSRSYCEITTKKKKLRTNLAMPQSCGTSAELINVDISGHHLHRASGSLEPPVSMWHEANGTRRCCDLYVTFADRGPSWLWDFFRLVCFVYLSP